MLKRSMLVLIWITCLVSACLPQVPSPPTTQPPAATLTPSYKPSPTQTKATPTRTLTKAPTPKVNDPPLGMDPPDSQITLMAVGDIMLGRTIAERILTEGVKAPFQYTAETLASADITVGNLECPISIRGTPVDKKYTFRAPLKAGESLAFAGFDLVSLANNHSLDYGPEALEDTLKILAKYEVKTIGAGMDAQSAYAPFITEVEGLQLAFLAYADVPTTDYDYKTWTAGFNKPGIAWAFPDRVSDEIQAAQDQADLVIVMIHNGYEIVQKVSGYQQEFAHLAINSGADLVIGSHPHVLQRTEEYQDGLIFYSLGNFVFDNFLFPPNYSTILSIELNRDGVVSYEMIDVVVGLDGIPQIMPYH